MKFAKKILASSLIAISLIAGAPNATAATNLSGTASSAYELAARGIQMSLSGLLMFFEDVQTAARAIDPNATMNLLSSGVINITLFGTTHGVLFTGVGCASPGVPASPYFAIVNGQLQFVNRNGTCNVAQVV